jgi:phosphate transport system substrate-binding protein
MRIRQVTILAPAVAVAVALGAPAVRADEVVRVSGTGSALGTMRRLSAAFASAHPGHRLQVFASVGSSGAVKAVSQGALDVGLSGRKLRPEEEALGVKGLLYARTPFVFAVGPRAGVSGITAGELVRIYRGELRSWPNGERVRLVVRPRAEADTLLVRAISSELDAAMDLALAREGMLMAVTNQECNEILARTPGAIGPSSLAQILSEDLPVAPLAWNGVAPTVANLASGAYPLSKDLIVVVRAPPSHAVRRFLAFLASPEARRILEETGNLPFPLPALE